MLTLVFKEGDVSSVLSIYKAKASFIDAVEIRLDLLQWDLEQIRFLRNKISHPVVFTDKWDALTEEKKAFIFSYLPLTPTFVDFEESIEESFWQECRKKFPKIRWILSYHNYQKTPKNLFSIFTSIEKRKSDLIKIACHCKNSLDALRMFEVARAIPSEKRIFVPMGIKGKWLRSLSFIFKNPFTYVACANKEKAFGQFSLEEFRKKALHTLHPKTQVYALLGSPVYQSIGDIFHNKTLKDQNGYYVKILVKKEELFPFLEKAKNLPFQGFSITMPLKETAHSYCLKENTLRTKFSVNTLKKIKGKFYGFNTDGSSCLDLIEEKGFQGFPLVILGPGGASKAIGILAKERGYKVYFMGRNGKELKALKNLGCEVFSFSKKVSSFSKAILVNGTPIGMDKKSLPVPEEFFSSKWLVFDLIYSPRKTPLIQKAQEKNCQVIVGKSLFIRQAEKQQKIWFSKKIDE